jgi:hypothetical protein
VGVMYCIWKYGKGRVGSKQFGGRTMGPCKGRDEGYGEFGWRIA